MRWNPTSYPSFSTSSTRYVKVSVYGVVCFQYLFISPVIVIRLKLHKAVISPYGKLSYSKGLNPDRLVGIVDMIRPGFVLIFFD